MSDFDALLLALLFLAVLLAALTIRGNFTASLRYRKGDPK